MPEFIGSTLPIVLSVVGAVLLIAILIAPFLVDSDESRLEYGPTEEELSRGEDIEEGDRVSFSFAGRVEEGEVVGRRGKKVEIRPDKAGTGVNEIVYRKTHQVQIA